MPVEPDLYRDGMARLEQGEVEAGRRLLEEALRAAPESVEIQHGLARALDLAGERARATELLERVNARAPAEPGPACDLAMFYMEREDNDRAERLLLPVLKAHPDHPRAHFYMAMALAKTEPVRASGHLQVALQDPDPEVRQQAEALHRVLGSLGPG
jgi:Tfp pilus assembly protein PilF